MNNLNQIIIEGKVKSSEVTDDGFDFIIEVSRIYKDADGNNLNETSRFPIVTYGKFAEACKKNCVIDRGVRIVGYLKQFKWIDGEGRKHSKTKIVAEHIEFKPMKESVNG